MSDGRTEPAPPAPPFDGPMAAHNAIAMLTRMYGGMLAQERERCAALERRVVIAEQQQRAAEEREALKVAELEGGIALRDREIERLLTGTGS